MSHLQHILAALVGNSIFMIMGPVKQTIAAQGGGGGGGGGGGIYKKALKNDK